MTNPSSVRTSIGPESFTGRHRLLSEAHDAVHGARNADYGPPYENMCRTAALWSAYLGVPIRADQVGWCMALVKISRLAESADHHDSMVDVAGWAAVAAETWEDQSYAEALDHEMHD